MLVVEVQVLQLLVQAVQAPDTMAYPGEQSLQVVDEAMHSRQLAPQGTQILTELSPRPTVQYLQVKTVGEPVAVQAVHPPGQLAQVALPIV